MPAAFSLPRHPFGVKPAGNVYTLEGSTERPFCGIPDELLVSFLELLEPRDLLSVGATSKALFAFSRSEDLWKTFCIENPPQPLVWRGSWYATYAKISEADTIKPQATGLVSDVLYRPFQCAHTPLEPYTLDIPKSNRIVRLQNLSTEEFSSVWADKPFILTEPVKSWPVYNSWTIDHLLSKYSNVPFRAEAVDWNFETYAQYMSQQSDESPLYLFDKSFAGKMSVSVGPKKDYWPPECFGSDLFNVLGSDRPDHRWLIVGPERSGSTFHKDPNATSAWNAVIQGSKYWIMFPAGTSLPPPPGVFVSEDQSEVTSPLSIAEWLLEFHAEARATRGCIEGICNAGEVLHVPSGWWHLVVNLAPSIAITQNFVPEAHLVEALKFLKDKADQVSGFRKDIEDPYSLFKERLEKQSPEKLQEALSVIEKSNKKRKWEELTNGSNTAQNGEKKSKTEQATFSFGFGDDDDADVP